MYIILKKKLLFIHINYKLKEENEWELFHHDLFHEGKNNWVIIGKLILLIQHQIMNLIFKGF